ncbi:putative multidrug export ATP-binding/permease protein [bacterium BMS3Bbin03]|nr:putative multidrug export ATP-binding/permease protein [bacterium BMS3Bbin03]
MSRFAISNDINIIKLLIDLFKDKKSEGKNVALLFGNEIQQEPFHISYVKNVFPYIMQHWKIGLFASILLLISVLSSLPQPLFIKYIINNVIINKDISILTIVIFSLIILLIMEAFFTFLKDFYFFQFEQNIIFEIQCRLFQKVLHFPKSFFDNEQTGYIMSRLSGDIFQLRLLFSSSVVEILTSVLKFTGAIVILFFLQWKLTLLSLTILPFFFITVQSLGKKTRILSYNMMEKSAQVSKNLQESISGISLIKTFVTEQKETQKVSQSLIESIQANIEQNTLNAFSKFAISIIASSGTVLVLWYGVKEIIFGHFTIGGYVAFISYLTYLYGPSRFLAIMHIHLQTAFAALKRVFTLFQIIPEDDSNKMEIKLFRLKGQITFENVCFSYNQKRFVLNNISFSIKSGEKVALVGHTGAGKSTIVYLILRLYKPQFGRISFDGIDANLLSVKNLRERIGIVSQEIFLFDDTIFNNILYGKPDATKEDVIIAAKKAQAHDFIIQLSKKYYTYVGERGVKLSMGQRQRISIARAILKNPDILILDEPTSAIDSITEEAIKKLIFEEMQNKTIITIAHNLSTISLVDKILVVNDGQIQNQGTHNELIVNDSVYKKMFESQFFFQTNLNKL